LPTKCTEGHESLIRLRLAFFSCRFAPARRSMRRLGVSWAALVKQNYGLLTDYSLFADEQNAALPDLGCADTSASAIRTDSSLGELESGSAVTGSPRSKGDAHAFDLCSPRRSLAHRREAARNSVFATRLVLNMLPRFNVCPSNSGAVVADGFSTHNRSPIADHLAASTCSEPGKLVWREICELRRHFPGVLCVRSNEHWDTSVEELRQ
jgi:hypothetical protein